MDQNLTVFLAMAFLTAALAFAFAAYLYLWVKRQSTVNAKIIEVSALIKQGANVFMRREYGVLAKFAIVAAVIIFLLLPQPVWKGGSLLPNLLMAGSSLARRCRQLRARSVFWLRPCPTPAVQKAHRKGLSLRS